MSKEKEKKPLEGEALEDDELEDVAGGRGSSVQPIKPVRPAAGDQDWLKTPNNPGFEPVKM